MKCPHCPRAGACRGESVSRLCQLVDPTHADHRPEYLSALEPPPGSPAPEPPPSRPDLSDARRAMRLGRLNCWYAGPPACGCSGSHRCHAIGRDATLRDCMACLKDVT